SALPAAGGRARHSAVWTRDPGRAAPAPGESAFHLFAGAEADYSGENFLAELQVDVTVWATGEGERRYAAVWHPPAGLASAEVHGLDPAAHRARCRKLIDNGFRPAALSAAQVRGGQPAVTASVWHRPVVADEDRECSARRQANAAVALLRTGRPDAVWPLLRHRPDPRVRSYLIHRLGSLGADPGGIVRRLEEEPDVSARRALLLCLGEFGPGPRSEERRVGEG